MELKVLHSTMTTYGGRWETRLELPVETELLIPDYLPAVFKIVKCLIRPVILHNDLAGCRWHGEGYLHGILPVGRRGRQAVAYRAEISL